MPLRIKENFKFSVWVMPAAGVAELVDALDLGSSGASRGGSSPSARTSPQSMPEL